jgi:hypothetical protein
MGGHIDMRLMDKATYRKRKFPLSKERPIDLKDSGQVIRIAKEFPLGALEEIVKVTARNLVNSQIKKYGKSFTDEQTNCVFTSLVEHLTSYEFLVLNTLAYIIKGKEDEWLKN